MSRRTKRRRTLSGRNILTVLIIAAAVIVVLFLINMGLTASGEVISYSSDSRTAFRAYRSDTLEYNKNGVSFYNSSWDLRWSDSYTMTSPLAVEREDYTAIYETGGRNVRVYNDDGLVYSVQTSDAVTSVSLNENGYIGVITNGTSYMVTVYSPSGNMLFQRVEAKSGIYPMCCDISPNGEIIAISYMDTTGVVITTEIGLFYVDADKGADYTDSMFAAMEKDDEIVFKLYFTSNSGFTAIGDRHIMTFSTAGVEESSVEVTNEIVGVGLSGSKVVLIYGDELSDKEGTEAGTVMLVSSGGGVSEGYSIGAEPDYITISDGGIVLGTSSAYYGISSGGKLSWTLNSTGNISIYPTSGINRCIYAAKTWAVTADMRNFDASEYEQTADTSADETTVTKETAEDTSSEELTESAGEETAEDENTDDEQTEISSEGETTEESNS